MALAMTHGEKKLFKEEMADQRHSADVTKKLEDLTGDLQKLNTGLDNLGFLHKADKTESVKATLEMTSKVLDNLKNGAYDGEISGDLEVLGKKVSKALESNDPRAAVVLMVQEINGMVRDVLNGTPEASIKEMTKAVKRFDKLYANKTRTMEKASYVSAKSTSFREWALAKGLDTLTNNSVNDVTKLEESIKKLTYAKAALDMLNGVAKRATNPNEGAPGAIDFALNYHQTFTTKAKVSEAMADVIKRANSSAILSILGEDSQKIKDKVSEYQGNPVASLDAIMQQNGINRTDPDAEARAREIFFNDVNKMNVMLFAKAHVYGSEQRQDTKNEINDILDNSNIVMRSFAGYLKSNGVSVNIAERPIPNISGSAQDILKAMDEANNSMDIFNKVDNAIQKQFQDLFANNPAALSEFLSALYNESGHIALTEARRGAPTTTVNENAVTLSA